RHTRFSRDWSSDVCSSDLVQDAVECGLSPDELTTFTDVTLLQRLAREDMPESTRRLVAGLSSRAIHKRAVEISSRAGALYDYLRSEERRGGKGCGSRGGRR